MASRDRVLPAERIGYGADPDLVARRRGMADGARSQVAAAGVEAADVVLGGTPCVALSPPDHAGELVYFHGGGYRIGTARLWVDFGSRLALATRRRVVLVDYRLAPEAPFPNAIHDGLRVYEALDGARGGAGGLVVGGDSAGGGLAAALTVATRLGGLRPPDALVLLSPWLDLTVTAGTFDSRRGTDRLFSEAAARQAADLYLQGHDPRDPLASPLFADVSSFPPTAICAGGHEVLLADAISFAAHLADADVSVQLNVEAGMPHVFPTTSPDLAASRLVLGEIVRFLDRDAEGW